MLWRALKTLELKVTYLNKDQKSIKNILFSIRISFLNQLEQWKEKSMSVASVWRRDKLEELESELDLRLHLHAPRPKRIELDVHNVRAGCLFVPNSLNILCPAKLATLLNLITVDYYC